MTEEEIRIDERIKIAARVRDRKILRWGQNMGTPLEQANESFRDLADDIENNFADYEDC